MTLTLWTSDEDAALREMHAAGKSAAEIAKRFPGRSRSAVIGRLFRNRQTPATKPVSAISVKASRKHGVRGGKPKSIKVHPGNLRGKKEGRKSDPGFVEKAVVPSKVVRLEDLKASSCRFPFGDPRAEGFGFCGGRRIPGYPYCSLHCSIAYQNFQCEVAS